MLFLMNGLGRFDQTKNIKSITKHDTLTVFDVKEASTNCFARLLYGHASTKIWMI